MTPSTSQTTQGDLEDVLLEEFRNSSSDDEDDLPLLALIEKVGENVHGDTDSSDSDLLLSMLYGKRQCSLLSIVSIFIEIKNCIEL